MNRRHFISLSGIGLLELLFANDILASKKIRAKSSYSIVILGDTHFDTEPDSVYHSFYDQKIEWLNRVQRAEFARNGEMWRERCPKLLKRASRLIDKNTKMVLQMGDLIQGDCGKGEIHQKMLSDVMDNFKRELGGLPFVTVVGNHDIRGVDAEKTYHDYMPARMSQELGKDIKKTTFSFYVGDDVYIVLDFNQPDDEEIERLLRDSEGARHTFVMSHGPLFPYDGGNCRWFFHGGESEADTIARRHFRQLFAQRHAICLCGHTHNTEFADWWGDGGRITQMTMNSVWSNEDLKQYHINAEGADQYGILRMKGKMDNGSDVKDETALFDEYRNGLRQYTHSPAAGSYKLQVSKKSITIDFYAGDSEELTHQFKIR